MSHVITPLNTINPHMWLMAWQWHHFLLASYRR